MIYALREIYAARVVDKLIRIKKERSFMATLLIFMLTFGWERLGRRTGWFGIQNNSASSNTAGWRALAMIRSGAALHRRSENNFREF